MLSARSVTRSGLNDQNIPGFNLLNFRQRISLYSLWLRLLRVLAMMDEELSGRARNDYTVVESAGSNSPSSQQLCAICQTVLEQYGSLDKMQPRNCVRWSNCMTFEQKLSADAKAAATQKNIYGCTCKVRTLKHSRRQVLYCRCE